MGVRRRLDEEATCHVGRLALAADRAAQGRRTPAGWARFAPFTGVRSADTVRPHERHGTRSSRTRATRNGPGPVCLDERVG